MPKAEGTLEELFQVASRERRAMTDALRTLTRQVVEEGEAQRDSEVNKLSKRMDEFEKTIQRRLSGLEDRQTWLEDALDDGSHG